MSSLITDEIRSSIGASESFGPIEVTRREIVKYAVATEQRLDRIKCGDEAPPGALSHRHRATVEASAQGRGEEAGAALECQRRWV